jgi:hypothetical protein
VLGELRGTWVPQPKSKSRGNRHNNNHRPRRQQNN